MPIQVDDRLGSAQLAPLLRNLGVEVDLCRLDYGDIAWTGYGVNGASVSCAVEAKKIEDCIACIQSGRFAGHQLPGLLQCYDHIWLLIIDDYRPRRRDGVLEYRKEGRGGGSYWAESCGRQKTILWRDVESWIMSMAILGGIRIHQVPDYDEAAAWIKMASNWFSRDSHKSHQVIHGTKEIFGDTALLVKPSLARRVAAQLPSVGTTRSAAVAAEFRTMEAMVAATEKDWRRVDGLGPVTAKKVWQAIHGTGGTGMNGSDKP